MAHLRDDNFVAVLLLGGLWLMGLPCLPIPCLPIGTG